ncbi:MAG: arginine N-succinyltransferase [Myxococcales bacterium]|nr:MAG: arginine N-succinyltransferase [Myxococcales bacterium]
MHDPKGLNTMTPRFTIRAGLPEDYNELLKLSQFLDSANLPNDPKPIKKLLDLSLDSFSGKIKDPTARKYVFAIHDEEEQSIVGTSMIIAQLGRREAPYVYFDIHREERYSDTLDKHFVHQVLTVRYSYNGPTEIGGLVVHPDYRKSEHKVGMLISYVRFLWIAMNRALVQDQILAELMPPLKEDGSSYLWEAVGRRFTNMTYREADRLSKGNKEFIRSLFPRQSIYTTLLSQEAQDVIGQVSPNTRGVETLLRSIGFEYANRVDPFDGGPDFIASTKDILLVKRSLEWQACLGKKKHDTHVLLAHQSSQAPFFVCIPAWCSFDERHNKCFVDDSILERLALTEGDRLWALPLSLS